MKLISSATALDLVLALTQRRDGARLAELAAAAGVSLSTAQAAAKLLLADRVAEREPVPRPRYRLREHPARDAIVQLAARYPSMERALDVALRANPAVEFAARDRDGYLVVEAALADPRDLALLESAIALIGAGRERPPRIARFGHHDLVDALRDEPAPRLRARAATVLKGSLARSFPDRARHPVRSERPRRHPRRSLAPLSRRALAAVARAYGLRHIRLFGSAARGDFHPDSDVDVLVEPRPGSTLSLVDLARLEAELERLFDRHVDVVTPGGLRDEVREEIEREGIALYDRGTERSDVAARRGGAARRRS